MTLEGSDLQFVDAILKQVKYKGDQQQIWEDIFAALQFHRRGVVNERGDHTWTLLHHAARCGQLWAAEQLVLEFNADLRARTLKEGRTAEQVALEHGHREVAAVLRELALKAEGME